MEVGRAFEYTELLTERKVVDMECRNSDEQNLLGRGYWSRVKKGEP